ncbi:MAG: type II toxin-antitoxin system HicA family toxin [Armatimonadota bacterium]
MSKLPQISGERAIRALVRAGWERARQRGSHVVLVKPGSIVTPSVPLHNPIGRGLLHDLIKKAGLTTEESLDHLR